MISIVMPVYNGQKYLSLAIESVLNQTYSDWELIIVNDCSTDSTSKIISQYSKIDERIRIITNSTNQKLPRSLNIGFRNAMGTYYTWTSDDNILHPDALQKMAEFMDKNPNTGLVYSDMNYIDENGCIISSTKNSCHMINLCNCIGASFLYRREVAEEIGEYDHNKILVEDYDYWIRIFSKYQISRLPVILYDYRFHSQSMTSTREDEIQKKVAELKLEYFDLLSKGLTDDEYQKFCLGIVLNDKHLEKNLFEKQCDINKNTINIQNMMCYEPSKKSIIIGAGVIGHKVYQLIGANRVYCYADNYKAGQTIDNKKIICVNEIFNMHKKYNIIIATGYMNAVDLIQQLEANGIEQFSVYQLIKDKLATVE